MVKKICMALPWLVTMHACVLKDAGRRTGAGLYQTAAQPADTVAGHAAERDAAGNALLFRCPPCKCGKDSLRYTRHGRCPSCQMTLVVTKNK